jgi:SAM-dependent methyltransferase
MPEVTTSSGGNPIVAKIYAAKSSAELQTLYNAWAAQYNQDLSDQDYQAPLHTAQAVLQHSPKPETIVSAFDAGCGTGLSGLALKSVLPNLKVLDGVDLSTGMLEQARQTGIYASLSTADLTKPISCKDNTYDVVICVGTLTHGHVGPSPALSEFVRIVKEGTGLVAVTILDDIWESEGFRGEVERLEEAKKVVVLARDSMPYRRAAGVNARVVVLRKC